MYQDWRNEEDHPAVLAFLGYFASDYQGLPGFVTDETPEKALAEWHEFRAELIKLPRDKLYRVAYEDVGTWEDDIPWAYPATAPTKEYLVDDDMGRVYVSLFDRTWDRVASFGQERIEHRPSTYEILLPLTAIRVTGWRMDDGSVILRQTIEDQGGGPGCYVVSYEQGDCEDGSAVKPVFGPDGIVPNPCAEMLYNSETRDFDRPSILHQLSPDTIDAVVERRLDEKAGIAASFREQFGVDEFAYDPRLDEELYPEKPVLGPAGREVEATFYEAEIGDGDISEQEPYDFTDSERLQIEMAESMERESGFRQQD